MNLKDRISRLKRVFLIHHWDTDGICSASLLGDELRGAEVCNRVPRIGTYRLTPRILKEAAQDWDALIVPDIRLPGEDFRTLRNITGTDILLFDHHLGNNLDGVIDLNPAHREDGSTHSPSTSWLVKDLLELPTGLRPLLGIVGDRGSIELPEGTARNNARRFLFRTGLDEKVLRDMSNLLDSNARVGDEFLVEQAAQELSRIGEDPQALLDHPVWTKNTQILDEEISRQVGQSGEAVDGVVVKKFQSRFDIVSAVARSLAWSGKYGIVVAVNAGFLPDQDQLYVRKGTSQINAPAIIRMVHRKGYSAGGKEEVVGMVVPKSDTEGFLQELLSQLVS